jgi:hypothetical protein
MKRNIGCVVLAVLLLGGAAASCRGGRNARTGSQAEKALLHPVFEKAGRAVFLLGGNEAGPAGTAFLVRHGDRNYIVTNFHVVSLMKDYYIETDDKVRTKDVTLLATDRADDLAVLEAKGLPDSIKPLEYTETYATSESIYVIGFPDMRSKVDRVNFATGVISDASYLAPVYIGTGTCRNIQITAPVSPGSSGSPVLDDEARVIGVIAWSFTPEDDIQAGNYAVPFKDVLALIGEIESRQQGTSISALYTPGGACKDDADCTWTYLCIDGTCQDLKDQGQPCAVDDDCYLPYICKSGACARAAQLGEPCRSDSQCEPPNYCILDVCRPLSQKNEPCRVDIDCVSPLYCIVGKCVKDLSGNGGPCAQTIDCYAPLQCAGGTCQPPP